MPPAEIDVEAIRKGLDMTQQVFGERFGFGPAPGSGEWEQKRTRPAASDRVLLVAIKFAPEVVLHALRPRRPSSSREPAELSPLASGRSNTLEHR